MCEEMKKLREVLDKKGVIWYDDSDTDTEYTDIMIYRTKFFVAQKDISVIYGHGTVGGCPVFGSGIDEKLLEMMIDNGEPEGHLTSSEIINHLAINIFKDVTEEEKDDNKKIGRLIEILESDEKEIKESESFDSEYDFYTVWPEDIAEEIDKLCCELFITTTGDVNLSKIFKFTSACGNMYDVVQGDGDSFGWLTGVITDAEGTIMYYCFG